ncbi:MAG: PLP-dependent aminotransferase family protein [Solirubrobacteraceae bacterium]|nr:PLP-dependent aminotransferase family protein [Solirubrobacteraceae bacterium]
MPGSGTGAAGPELLVELDRSATRTLRAQLEDGLRGAVHAGRLAPGAAMPSSRAMARDLDVSRRLVVDAYAQLVAEGYLATRPGAGTFVAGTAGGAVSTGGPLASGGAVAPRGPAVSGGSAVAGVPATTGRTRSATVPPAPPRFDLFPGRPDLSAFPRAAWTRALRDVLRALPDHRLGYPDPAGVPELRGVLADYLARARGVVAGPERIVVTSGAVQGLALLARALAAGGPAVVAVEDPSLPDHRRALEHAGVRIRPVPVDDDGVWVDGLGDATAALVTPAHQMPTGVALSQERRAAIVSWARSGGLVIEDDYDAEFRYDRPPLAALQGLAPDDVVHVGSVSKTLAPALRLGWLVLPHRLVAPVVGEKLLDDMGGDALSQLTLARLVETGGYDRHLRTLRRRHRARRDALTAALARHLPQARVLGVAAGLHATVALPRPIDPLALDAALAERSVRVYGMTPRSLLVGYAAHPAPALDEAVRRLADALAEVGGATYPNARAIARPAVRPLNMHPPTKVPSSEL